MPVYPKQIYIATILYLRVHAVPFGKVRFKNKADIFQEFFPRIGIVA
jgi:hypothetical protein